MSTEPQKPFGKYFLLDKLGMGGMAEIYKAKTFGSDGFEKTVVIKKILSHWANDPEFIRMLVDEAKLSVMLDHPNVVDVMDLGSVENTYYIAMAFVDGFDLKTLMNRVEEKGQKIPIDVACYIIMQTAAGLDYAHNKISPDGKALNIIHRDVSPHNILLSYNGEVKIGDFGIAKAASKGSFTATGMLKGKFSYMSPEQTRGETLNQQSDIFPLGVVLYEMITGKKCFDGDTALAILEKIRHCNLKAEDLPASIPDPLRQILAKAMAGSLADRYQSAEAFQVDLAHFLSQYHPGFLPKDLAAFMKEFKKDTLGVEASKNEPTLKKNPQEALVMQSSETSVSFVPGYQSGKAPPQETPKKSSSTLLWILLILFFFFGAASVGAYVVWVKIIQPKLAAQKVPTSPLVTAPSAPLTIPAFPSLTPTPPPTNPGEIPTPTVNPTVNTPIAPSNQLPNMGFVEVKSNPPGAEIMLDKKYTGLKTPAVIPNLALYVSHAISLQMNGYENWEKSVTLINTNPLSLEASLNKVEFGQANVISNPAGAKIFLNDVDTGLVTPNNIAQLPLNQPARIRLMKEGYLAVEAVYTPINGTLQPIDIPMKAAPSAAPKAKRKSSGGGGSAPLRQYAPPPSGGGGLWVN